MFSCQRTQHESSSTSLYHHLVVETTREQSCYAHRRGPHSNVSGNEYDQGQMVLCNEIPHAQIQAFDRLQGLYVILVSKFLEYFEVDRDGELFKSINPQNEITNATLHKVGLLEVNNDHWMCKDDIVGGSNAKIYITTSFMLLVFSIWMIKWRPFRNNTDKLSLWKG